MWEFLDSIPFRENENESKCSKGKQINGNQKKQKTKTQFTFILNNENSIYYITELFPL